MTVDITNVTGNASGAQVSKASRTREIDTSTKEKPLSNAVESGPTKSLQSDQLKGLIDNANQLMEVQKRRIQFSVDEATGGNIVRVYDEETNELIRQYPPEEVVSLMAKVDEMLSDVKPGFILNDEA